MKSPAPCGAGELTARDLHPAFGRHYTRGLEPPPSGGAGQETRLLSTASKFTRDGVRDYEKRRYRGLDQRLVHAREMRLLKKAFSRIDRERTAESAGHAWGEERRVLDLPCGYGRFTDFLTGLGRTVVNSDLSLEMVRRAGGSLGRPGGRGRRRGRPAVQGGQL